jgi:hypothetical protein
MLDPQLAKGTPYRTEKNTHSAKHTGPQPLSIMTRDKEEMQAGKYKTSEGKHSKYHTKHNSITSGKDTKTSDHPRQT